MTNNSEYSLEQAYQAVKNLADDFKANERNYLSPTYQEYNVRQDFVDKFFIALGWDVTHERQKNPHEYEVQVENRISGLGTQRRADYAFFLAPNFRDPKFFVEAKKPARQLKSPDFFFQTMSYGWPKNTPVAILTDFEELYLIDCRLKPSIKHALERELKSFRYTDYLDEEKFRWIYYLLSHEAVADGSIEKFAEKLARPKGKAVHGVSKFQPFDEVFLAELDDYRAKLAKAFKKSNQDLQGEELTEAVQRTLDRLVFMRFLEDKLIKEKEVANLIDRKLAWELFSRYSRKLDPKYNGLIFKPHPVIDAEGFNPPDEEVFQEVCKGLAGPDSPYNFDQIPISILGNIYERFLGKVVHATAKQAKVQDKPEVRKAGGVYYTPDYIVRYIVKETVGKLIEGKTPAEISNMAFADIACGSGSFLIEVYDLLLKYHERYYADHPDKAKRSDLSNRSGQKVLSLKKRQEILVNNIYGVDIDYQATEVTQLSLYLKHLEDVTTNDAYQFTLTKDKILPNLSRNIICGNSLIGTDISEGTLFPDIDESKLKPMNFEDAFPDVMKRGGFDAVVGNPPYIRIQTLRETNPEAAKYFTRRYSSAIAGNYDIYVIFVEQVLQNLSNEGVLGYILPHKFFNAQYGEALRGLISKGKHLRKIVFFGDMQIFDGPTIYTCLLFLNKAGSDEFDFDSIKDLAEWRRKNKAETQKCHSSLIRELEWNFHIGKGRDLLDRLTNMPVKLANIADRIYQGLVTGADSVFLLTNLDSGEYQSEATGSAHSIEKELMHPLCKGSVNIRRYRIEGVTKSILFPYRLVDGKAELIAQEVFRLRYPKAWAYLNVNRKLLEGRERGKWKHKNWYAFARSQNLSEMDQKKILTPSIAKEASFTFDSGGNLYFVGSGGGGGGYGITIKRDYPVSPLFVLGLLNSKLLDYCLKSISTTFRGGYYAYNRQYIENLPITTVNLDDPDDQSRHEHVAKLVERMLVVKEELSKAKTEAEANRLDRECESLDRQIDQAVYELYGLTEEEIKVVEGK